MDVNAQVHLDASLVGLGEVNNNSMVCALLTLPGYQGCCIVQIEILNILVACKFWRPTGKTGKYLGGGGG